MIEFLDKAHTGFILIDVQERLFPLVENHAAALAMMIKAVKGFQILGLPGFVTEQYPEKMGATISALNAITKEYPHFAKTAFSCFKDQNFKEAFMTTPVNTWILLGIEAHVCVWQTAKDIMLAGKQCVVLNDAISSRASNDYLTALHEMRAIGIRVTTTETALFELLKDSKVSEFKAISQLIK